MNLYMWNSEYLADWANGDIIVMANDVNEARAKARESFNKCTPYQEDDESYLDDLRRFEEDIEPEPIEITDGVIFITGSA